MRSNTFFVVQSPKEDFEIKEEEKIEVFVNVYHKVFMGHTRFSF